MSANPHRQNPGQSRVLLIDKKTHEVCEEIGHFGNFHEAYWWANQNGFELRQYVTLN